MRRNEKSRTRPEEMELFADDGARSRTMLKSESEVEMSADCSSDPSLS